ncbi:MAG: hypothetical protein GY754_23060, partial [bacterium]|nr:hypothetical protein [bacterium]
MNSKWVIKPLVPEEVYTDREEFLEYFYHAALEAAHRRTMSTVLLGQRRMGKTEIFKRVVNRLFMEQDPKDSNAVVPIYYSFREEELDRWDFSVNYTENFIRWYAAFHLRDPGILSSKYVKRDDLRGFLQTRLEVTHAMTGALNLLEFLQGKDVTLPEDEALTLPRFVSDHDDSTI